MGSNKNEMSLKLFKLLGSYNKIIGLFLQCALAPQIRIMPTRTRKNTYMSGNSIGLNFSLSTFGESHGAALGAVVDGCPPGVEISEEELQCDLDRRRPGQSKYTTQRNEPDQIKILSGVFEGKTTGASIGLLIENTDQKSKDYSNIKDLFRPAHADYTYHQKYGVRDYRGGGRSSARETAMRVAAGAIAKKVLKQLCNVEISGYMSEMGHLKVNQVDLTEVPKNAFFCPDKNLIPALEELITTLRKEGDSVGARVDVIADGVPPGWGEPVFDRLDADLAKALMSINAVKGVEIGAGFGSIRQRGSEHRDSITPNGFKTNHAGGVLGGISSGQQISASIALKPTSSITQPGETIDTEGNSVEVVTKGRHDPCVGIRAVPIAEAMTAIVLLDHFIRHRGQTGVTVTNTPIVPASID